RGIGEGVEQGAFSGVRIANQRNDGLQRSAAAAAVLVTVFADLFQLALEEGNAAVDLPAVGLWLGLTGAAHAAPPPCAPSAPADLAGQVCPGACEPGQPVFILRQFNLHRAFTRARMAGEDV